MRWISHSSQLWLRGVLQLTDCPITIYKTTSKQTPTGRIFDFSKKKGYMTIYGYTTANSTT